MENDPASSKLNSWLWAVVFGQESPISDLFDRTARKDVLCEFSL